MRWINSTASSNCHKDLIVWNYVNNDGVIAGTIWVEPASIRWILKASSGSSKTVGQAKVAIEKLLQMVSNV